MDRRQRRINGVVKEKFPDGPQTDETTSVRASLCSVCTPRNQTFIKPDFYICGRKRSLANA
jgi:hypothetical protein